jgi:hypothetical protein
LNALVVQQRNAIKLIVNYQIALPRNIATATANDFARPKPIFGGQTSLVQETSEAVFPDRSFRASMLNLCRYSEISAHLKAYFLEKRSCIHGYLSNVGKLISSPPKLLKPRRIGRRVNDGVPDVAMPKVVLDQARVGGQSQPGQVPIFADRKPGGAPVEGLALLAHKKRPAGVDICPVNSGAAKRK